MTVDEVRVETAQFRCAAWTRAQDVDPVGSALHCDTLVLIEADPPWPADIGDIPAFEQIMKRTPKRTRLLAVRPTAPRRDDDVHVTVWRRADVGMTGTDHVVAGARLADSVVQLLDDPGSATSTPAPAEVLLCGHGSRDGCCGRFGTRLALDVTETWPGVRVRRCSHTGGHRFAPTGFTLPDGRSWGYLDEHVLDAIVRRADAPPLHGHYRGNTALDMWAQAVERELFDRHGWGWLDHRITAAETDVADDKRSAAVRLEWDGPHGAASAHAVVEVARDVPVLVCGAPPDRAKKTAPDLRLASFDLRAAVGGPTS